MQTIGMNGSICGSGEDRITPEKITHLKSNEIFVFGSNTEGKHGGGAAWFAHKNFGAEWGVAHGISGKTYAIATCTPSIEELPIEAISESVRKFIAHAKQTPSQTYLVTPIGCGIAGFTPEEIAPLFNGAIDVENIHLPESFWKILN